MSEQNNPTNENVHTAPILTLNPEVGDKQVIEKAVDLLNDLEAPAAPDAASRVVSQFRPLIRASHSLARNTARFLGCRATFPSCRPAGSCGDHGCCTRECTGR